jgi:hypothetical protein
VILLENSNEWNLSPAKEGSSKKGRERKKRKREKERKKEQELKSKRVETSYEEAPCFKRRKKKRMKFTCCWEIFYRKKGDHIFL